MAARAKPATTYLATVRASRGMGESSHLRAALSGDHSTVAQLREPDRASAASALYRHLVLPESLRILRGDYRRIRLRTPTLLLFGAADSAFPPALANRVLQDHRTYADHLEVDFVADAAHFIADERPDAVVDHALEFFPRSANGSEFRSCGSLRMSLT